MPVMMTSFLLPQSPALPYLLEDTYIKGGLRVAPDFESLGKILPAARKIGMLAYCLAEKKFYQMGEDRINWAEWKVGVTSEEIEAAFDLTKFLEVQSPIVMTKSGDKQILSLAQGQVIPPAPGAGYTLVSGANNSFIWVDLSGTNDRGVRSEAEYEAATFLPPGATEDFSITSCASAMLIDVILNMPDMKFQIFPDEQRLDQNPYTFISSPDMMQDVGITIQEDKKTYHRRYALVAHQTKAARFVCRFTNVGDVPSRPKVSLVYLALE